MPVAHDGETPLLDETADSIDEEIALLNAPQVERVPWAQFAVLLLIRMIPRICFVQILPYVVPFLLHLGADPSNVGYSAGLLESRYPLFTLLMLETSRWTSDKFGRRPTLLVSLAVAGTICAMCGFSRSLSLAMLTRAMLGGAVAFVVPTCLTMCTEIATNKTQAIAFAIFGTGGVLGSTIAVRHSHTCDHAITLKTLSALDRGALRRTCVQMAPIAGHAVGKISLRASGMRGMYHLILAWRSAADTNIRSPPWL